ncbi:MAG: hypothetical protein IKU78_01385 [Paludibacteraceae bacterium]|nr:hypothetical protein [Paludibacteraceae bacterium]
MANNSYNIALLHLRKYFSNIDFMNISKRLSNADSEILWRVQSLSYKDPTITLILNLTLGFGAGAFYVGKIEYAVTQLICYLILIPLCVIVEFSDSVGVALLFCILTFVILGLFIASVINARKWTFEYNYKKFAEICPTL